MEDTVASTSPARRRETILNEVKVKKPAQFAIARLFSQARSQMKQEAFSLRFTSIYSLCGASHSKVLVPITEFQTKPVKRKKKKNPPCHIDLRGHRRISKNCLLGQSFYCFRALLVHDIYAVFFPLRFATAWSRKAKYTAAGGGLCGRRATIGNQLLMGFPLF